MNKLSATEIERKLGSKPGRHSDGAGLYLQVKETGTKSWIFQFVSRGRERQMGLGSADVVTLKQARDKAAAARDLLAAGKDPIDEKHQARKATIVKDAPPVTFEQASEDFLTAHGPAWRNPKHRQQWASTLRTYAYPVIGSLSVAEVETAHILKILRPIWTTTPETAQRLRGRIENILDSATAAGHRAGDNCARWKGHLAHLLPPPNKLKNTRHHPAMPFPEMPAFMATLQRRKGISVRALEVLILTAARTGEIIAMTDAELDLDEKLWTVPAERMKAGREHIVPLCDRAVKILRSIPREKGNPFLFAGMSSGTHLSNMAMLAFMKQIAPDFTPHGFRSSFTDWANETTPTPHHVVEMALAHTIGNKTEAAYRRGDLLAKRRELMNLWEAFLYPSANKP